MAVADVHPSVEELAAFTLGTLDYETHVSIEIHVASCTSCQERAANARSDSLSNYCAASMRARAAGPVRLPMRWRKP
ncbi:MAG TPA: hypothetical protein VE999_11710 [Gemmataceae bacterium]|nr:hypothetical protein [Gemmataceae bacterium]